MKVRYKGSLVKDEVHIDAMRTDIKYMQALEKVFGKIPSPLPDGVLKVKFWVYKKKKSWISCNGTSINFEYNLIRLLKDSENDHYQLSFLVDYHPALRGMRHYALPVGQDCYPKKIIIKHLIDRLIA